MRGVVSSLAQLHHRLPWCFKEYFAKVGLDVNDPKFLELVGSDHQKWSGAYTAEWAKYIEKNPVPDVTNILEHLKTLADYPYRIYR